MAQTNDTIFHPWLHRFAVLTAVITLVLLGVGGLVTSHGVGMAVPDWPNTYGYNMFLFPVSKWVGGIFYEHTHRLIASFVGLLTAILAVWLWVVETRGATRKIGASVILGVLVLMGGLMGVREHTVFLGLAAVAAVGMLFGIYQFQRDAHALRWLGILALATVILQGVLGGLRVVLYKDELGIFHATLAQLFFALICAIALLTSSWWRKGSTLCASPSSGRGESSSFVSRNLSSLLLATTAIILLQLILGATMRHQHAGLAIPDFPLAYGKLWPAMDAESVMRYNQQRQEITAAHPITAFQIGLQMTHRLVAVVILIGVVWCAQRLRRELGGKHPLTRLGWFWLATIVVQAALGAFTLWTNKAADVATAHVLVGALSLVTGALACIIAFRQSAPLRAAPATAAFDLTRPELGSRPVAAQK
ncbi:MAG: COX15/CtaA family protein [Verrucomicrobia bacterium]|nr:COX15/CtaA family protein [Verrucomicrobiota bacterium]